MKRLIFITVIGIIMMLMMSNSSCSTEPATDQKMSRIQEQLYQEALKEVGFPAVKNFTVLRELKTIYELCDQNNLINYCYTVNNFTGKFILIGKCLGYGIPYATQFSNPESHTNIGNESNCGYNLPQPEPDMTFKPADARGTWVVLFDPDTNQPFVTYWEPDIITIPFKLPDNLCQK